MTWTYRRLCLALAGLFAVAGAIVARPPHQAGARGAAAQVTAACAHTALDADTITSPSRG